MALSTPPPAEEAPQFSCTAGTARKYADKFELVDGRKEI